MIEDTAFAVEARGPAPEDILIGAELARRPARPPNFAAESEALHTLARLLIDYPEALPRRLAEIALDLCHAGSAGVSLLEETPQGAVFRWTALAGQLAPYEGGTTPRGFSPCGLCLDRGEAILVADPARRFDYFNAVSSRIVEGLVLPLFGAARRPLGTLWIVAHDRERQFDSEDLRVMTRLADFTALAIECDAAHAEAKAGEQRLRELLDALPAAIYTTDAAGRITYCNEAAIDLAGRRPELGRDEWCVTGRLYRPNGTPLPPQEYPIAVALKENRPVTGEEAVAERPDGTRVPFIPYPTPLRDGSGTLVGAVNMLVDITERKRAEAALRDSRAQLEKELAAAQRLQEASTRLMQEGDVRTLYDQILAAAIAIMHSDMASMQMLDPERGDLQLLAWTGFGSGSAAFWERVRADSGSACGMALRTGQRVIVPDIETCSFIVDTPEFDAYRRLGVRAVQSTPLISRDGRTLGMISTHWREPHQPAAGDVRLLDVLARQAADLIERANAEAELRESAAQFHTLAESIPQLAWMARPDGWIFWYNQRWYNYTGTTLVEMQGWGWRKVHHPDHEQRVVERIQRSWDTGEPWEDTFPLRAADGRYRWFLSRALPIRDADGRIVRWLGTNTDVTEQREAQEAQQRASQMLEERVAERTRELAAEMAERRKAEAALQQARHLEAIGQLTGGVAHDFNNLLTVIAGQSEGIAAAAKDDDIRRRAAAIQRAAERGARLTDQLLAFSRRQRLSPQRVTIGRLMADIDDLVRRAVGDAVAVTFSADSDLWPSLVDPAQFESAILNLAINAKDAMPDGGRLAIAARNAAVDAAEALRLDIRPGDYVVVSVADTGTGMPADICDRAFEPFFTTKDVGKGTGLGLAQIYGFVRQSGGTVALESTLGKGTTVSLHLPRAQAEPAEELPLPGEPILPRAAARKTILVVEDQSDVREVIEASLSDLGYRILTASDGIKARQMLDSAESIDLLLTDLVMPNGVSGLDLIEGARRVRQDLKIVLVSGHARDAKLRATGPRDDFLFLEKPFRQAELAQTIATALGSGRG